ncbi:MAG: BMP family ABC transporter substrate-binding protein [Candidatus Nanopelagicales bacterium]
MIKGMKLAAVLAAGALALAACGGSSDSGSSSSAPASDTASASASDEASPDTSESLVEAKVGLAYDIGGRGDQSFNDSAAAGLDKAVETYGIETKELEATGGETDAQKEERLTTLAEAGYNPIIAVGFAYAVAMDSVAQQFPDVNFAIIDDASSELPNLANLTFAENEGSYLVGAIAAEASESGNIGFVGGVNVPLIQKFQAGYEAGAKAINPDIKIQVKYLTEPPDFSGFGDPAKGKVAAEGMFQNGADVVYHAAGGSGGGVFQAAKAAKGWAIGVDSDQYLTATDDVKDVILTSMLKRVDVAVFDFITSFVEGSTLTGVQVFDLAADGVGYSTSNPAVDPYTAKANELADQIKAGDITVPDSM